MKGTFNVTRQQSTTESSNQYANFLRDFMLAHLFLDAPSHLYKRMFPSVCPSLRKSVCPNRVIFEGEKYAVGHSLRMLGASCTVYPALFAFLMSLFFCLRLTFHPPPVPRFYSLPPSHSSQQWWRQWQRRQWRQWRQWKWQQWWHFDSQV